MTAINRLRSLGQSLWLDGVGRGMLDDGRLQTLIDDFSITGLASMPTRVDGFSGAIDVDDIEHRIPSTAGLHGEALLRTLVLDDARAAADLFRPLFEASAGAEGWASLAVSPKVVADTPRLVAAVTECHARAERPNLLIEIPGTAAGMPAIEAAIFAGVPVRITLLCSRAQYLAAAQAYMNGIERRLAAGLDANVASIASLVVSPWDSALRLGLPADVRQKVAAPTTRSTYYRRYREAGVDSQVAAVTAMHFDWDQPNERTEIPQDLHDRVGTAVAQRSYRAYRKLRDSRRWRRLAAAGAPPQRLLWSDTASLDPFASDTLYVDALAAPGTINGVTEKTVRAFADHGQLRGAIAHHSEDGEIVLARCTRAGINLDAMAGMLQRDRLQSAATSWDALLQALTQRHVTIAQATA
ncbi:transaldolase family protein [Salinisphaera sp. RV14]|uniref:transaldolase family protein n=1 Tax=unclassified Salinisphaera TaxID=2649847 RepID=UPI003F87B9A1